MTVALLAFPQFFDNNGNPLSGGKVFTYAAGTSTPLATFTDRGGGTANSNPVILDSSGRADIWLSINVAYKLRIEDAMGTVMDTVDQYYGGADPAQLTTAGIVPSTGGTYSGLVSFAGGATFDGNAAQDLATLDSLNIAAVQTQNLWINPEGGIIFDALGSRADSSYGPEQIVMLCDTGSVTVSQVANPLDGARTALRLLQPDAGSKRMGFEQIIEARDCVPYRGRNIAFALKIRVSAATTIRAAIVAWTGTEDSPTRDVVNNWASTNYTAGNFFVASTSTIAVTASAIPTNTWTDMVVSSASPGGVVVPSTTNNLYLVVWTDATQGQNVTLDATMIRCGQGTVAPLWSPPNTGTEVVKCQRFYENGTLRMTSAYPSGSSNAQLTSQIQFKATKRIVPAMSQLGTSTSTNVSANSFVSPDVAGVGVNMVIGAGAGLYSLNLDWSASSRF